MECIVDSVMAIRMLVWKLGKNITTVIYRLTREERVRGWKDFFQSLFFVSICDKRKVIINKYRRNTDFNKNDMQLIKAAPEEKINPAIGFW